MDEDKVVEQTEHKTKKGRRKSKPAPPFQDRTPEERRELGRNGGLKSVETRRKQKALRDAGKQLLWHSLKRVPEEKEIVLTLKQMGIDDPTGADAIMLAQYVRARRGDTDAARFIRDTIGEKPSQQVELNLVDKPLDAIDFAALDDEQLEALAAARNMTLIAGPVIDVEPVELKRSEQRPANPEGLLWDADGEIPFQEELSKPLKKKPGPIPKSIFEQSPRRSPEELEEYREKQRMWKEDSDWYKRTQAEKAKAKAEAAAQEAAEAAAYEAAMEERFGDLYSRND